MRWSVALIALSILLATSCGSKSTGPKPDYVNRDYVPAWSPDGGTIAYLHGESAESSEGVLYLRLIDAVTGNLQDQLLVDGNIPFPFELAWSADGKWILFSSSPGIFRISLNLDTLVQLTSGQFHNAPSWSRSKEIIFFTQPFVATGRLLSTTIEGDTVMRWSTVETLVSHVTCFPDSSDSLVGWTYVDQARQLCVFDPDSIESAILLSPRSTISGPCRMSTDHTYISYTGATESILGGTLFLFDRATEKSTRLTTAMTYGSDFSPDGAKLVYPRLTKEVGLWIVDVATLEQTRLTSRQN